MLPHKSGEYQKQRHNASFRGIILFAGIISFYSNTRLCKAPTMRKETEK